MPNKRFAPSTYEDDGELPDLFSFVSAVNQESYGMLPDPVQDLDIPIKKDPDMIIDTVPAWPMHTQETIKEKIDLINPPQGKKRPDDNCLPCGIAFLKWMNNNILEPATAQAPKSENIEKFRNAAVLIDQEQATNVPGKPQVLIIGDKEHPYIDVDAPAVISFEECNFSNLKNTFDTMQLKQANGGKCLAGMIFLEYSEEYLTKYRKKLTMDEGFEGHFLNFYIYQEEGKKLKILIIDPQTAEIRQLNSFIKSTKGTYKDTLYLWWDKFSNFPKKNAADVKIEPGLETLTMQAEEESSSSQLSSRDSSSKPEEVNNNSRQKKIAHHEDIGDHEDEDLEQIGMDEADEDEEDEDEDLADMGEDEDEEAYQPGDELDSNALYKSSRRSKSRKISLVEQIGGDNVQKYSFPERAVEDNHTAGKAPRNASLMSVKKRLAASKQPRGHAVSRLSNAPVDLDLVSSSEPEDKEDSRPKKRLVLKIPAAIAQINSYKYLNPRAQCRRDEDILTFVIQELTTTPDLKALKLSKDTFSSQMISKAWSVDSQIINFIAENHPHIRVIDLGLEIGSENITDQLIFKLVSRCRSIEELSLRNCYAITDTCINDLLDNLPIRKLNLSSCPGITRLSAHYITQKVRDLTHLDMTFSTIDVDDILKAISDACPHIQHLGLGDCTLKLSGFNALVENCKQLTSLDFGSAVFGKGMLEHFAETAAKLPHLRDLNIPEYTSTNTVNELFKKCKSLATINCLNPEGDGLSICLDELGGKIITSINSKNEIKEPRRYPYRIEGQGINMVIEKFGEGEKATFSLSRKK